jgi:glycosyltransferase involved in cell wall biosynthesis
VAALSILHVAQPVDGGVARCVVDLVADQVGRGWRVGVACPAAGPLAAEIRERGAEHHDWPARRGPGPTVPLETVRLARVVRRVSPDVVHLHSSKAGLAGRLVPRGGRIVVFQPHAWSFYALEGSMRRAAIAWERLSARRAATIVCVSEGERAAGELAGINGRWRVVPNGIDLDAFRLASEQERTEARRRLGLGEGPLVVCVGRLSRQKGQDLLLDAWPEVSGRVEGAELVLVGSGPEESALRRRGARLAGAQTDVRGWLAAADVVVVPSRWEGLAYVVLEAMALGRPVVATRVAGMAEALGDAGTIVPPEDPDSLADALARRLVDPAGAPGARERVERLYSIARATNAMAELYSELLEGGRSQ